MAVIHLVRFLRTEQRYWQRLPVHEMRRLLEKQTQKLPTLLVMYVVLILIMGYNNATIWWDQVVFPPQTANDWWICIGMGLPILLAGSFCVNLWRYRQARRLLNREVRV